MENASKNKPSPKKKIDKVVNLNLFKIKRTLTNEGFEVIEDEKGELKLIIRVP